MKKKGEEIFAGSTEHACVMASHPKVSGEEGGEYGGIPLRRMNEKKFEQFPPHFFSALFLRFSALFLLFSALFIVGTLYRSISI